MSAKKSNITNGQNIEENTTLQEISKSDDTSHVSEIIKEKLTELLEPTEVITEVATPKDTFIPFTQTEENTIHLEHEIEPEEITPEEAALFEQDDTFLKSNTQNIFEDNEKDEEQQQIEETEENPQKQNITEEEFENVLKNDSKEIKLHDEGYVYMNVMETFVKEVIMDYMKQYASCTCNHCIIDTMALALTNLPSKYIVVKKGTLPPLLHMYRTKYSTLISTEVLKACLAVGKSPHHDKK